MFDFHVELLYFHRIRTTEISFLFTCEHMRLKLKANKGIQVCLLRQASHRK